MTDEDWIKPIQKTGSNSAVEGFYNLSDILDEKEMTENEYRGIGMALRSLAQKAFQKASTAEAKRKRPWEFK